MVALNFCRKKVELGYRRSSSLITSQRRHSKKVIIKKMDSAFVRSVTIFVDSWFLSFLSEFNACFLGFAIALYFALQAHRSLCKLSYVKPNQISRTTCLRENKVYQQEVDVVVSVWEQLQLSFFPHGVFSLLVEVLEQSLSLGQCGSLFSSEQLLHLVVPPLDGTQQLDADFLAVLLHGLYWALRRERVSNTLALFFFFIEEVIQF